MTAKKNRPIRTIGYIVVASDGRPVRWYESEQQFYRALFTPSVWPREGRKHVLRCVKLHNRTIHGRQTHTALYSLRILSLRDPLPYQYK